MENSDHIFIPGEKKHSTQVQMLYFSAYMIAGLSLRCTWFSLHPSVSYVFALVSANRHPLPQPCSSHTVSAPITHTHTQVTWHIACCRPPSWQSWLSHKEVNYTCQHCYYQWWRSISYCRWVKRNQGLQWPSSSG